MGDGNGLGQVVGPAGWAVQGEKIEGRGRGRKRTRARPKEIEKRGFGLEREGERKKGFRVVFLVLLCCKLKHTNEQKLMQ